MMSRRLALSFELECNLSDPAIDFGVVEFRAVRCEFKSQDVIHGC